MNTPEDPLRSAACVAQRIELIDRNLKVAADMGLAVGQSQPSGSRGRRNARRRNA
jgi:hypothetical protein